MLLLEEHRTVGVPSHCSGLISLRTLRESEIGEEAIMHRVTGAFVHTQSGSEVAFGGGATRAVAIDRLAWDQTLAEQAQAAGAELVRARVIGVERRNSHVELRTQTDGLESTLSARLVVGADGTHSRVRRSLGMGAPREYAYNLGIEGRLKARRDDFVHVFVGRDLAPGWFGWIIPTGDGMVRAVERCDLNRTSVACNISVASLPCQGRFSFRSQRAFWCTECVISAEGEHDVA